MEATVKIKKLIKRTEKKDGTPYRPHKDGSQRIYYTFMDDNEVWYSTWNGGRVYGHNEGDTVIINYKTGEYGNEIISLVRTDDVDINTDMQEKLLQEGVPMEQPKPNVQLEPPVSPKTPVSKDVSIKRQAVGKIASWCLQAGAQSGVKFKDMNEVMEKFISAAITIEEQFINRVPEAPPF